MKTNTGEDALSRLIQLQAARHDIRLAWSGNGTSDLIALCHAHSAHARVSKHLWVSLRELLQMPEMRQLPEAIQAQIYSTTLKAQALTELEGEALSKRPAPPPTKPRGARA
jgi:hypothetical protein